MTIILRWILVMALAGVAAACQSTRSQHYGSGPLTLSPGVQAAFGRYMQTFTPGLFVVSTDGLAAYFIYCPETNCGDSISYYAISTCESKFSRSCKIYADGRSIVWNFGGPQAGAVPPSGDGSEARKFSRPFSATWNTRPVSGTIDFEEGVASGKMRLQHPNGLGECAGTYAFQSQRGTWGLTCPENKTAYGVLTLLGSAQGSMGEGVDSDGNRIFFRVDGANYADGSMALRSRKTGMTMRPTRP